MRRKVEKIGVDPMVICSDTGADTDLSTGGAQILMASIARVGGHGGHEPCN